MFMFGYIALMSNVTISWLFEINLRFFNGFFHESQRLKEHFNISLNLLKFINFNKWNRCHMFPEVCHYLQDRYKLQ